MVNHAFFNVLTTTKYPPISKLHALRFFKDLFISSQLLLVDNLHEAIFKHIAKVCQFDKDSKDKSKRGLAYFQQAQKRTKQKDTQKISYSYVLFATQLIYVMGKWYEFNENQEKTQYAMVFDKLKQSGVPFPAEDKELRFFKPDEKEIFTKNFKAFAQKLASIEQEPQQSDKQNIKSRKQIFSKSKIPSIQEEAVINIAELGYRQSLTNFKVEKPTISQGDIKVMNLTKQNKQLSQKISKISQQNQNLSSQVLSLRSQGDSLKQKYASLQLQSNEKQICLKKQIQMIKYQHNNSLSNNSKNEQLRINLISQQGQAQSLRLRIKTLQGQTLKSKDQLKQAKILLQTKNQENNLLKRQIANHKQTINDLGLKMDSFQTERQAKMAKRDTELKQTLQKQRVEIQGLRNDLLAARQLAEAKQSDLLICRSDLLQAQQKRVHSISTLQKLISSKDADILNLRQKISDIQKNEKHDFKDKVNSMTTYLARQVQRKSETKSKNLSLGKTEQSASKLRNLRQTSYNQQSFYENHNHKNSEHLQPRLHKKTTSSFSTNQLWGGIRCDSEYRKTDEYTKTLKKSTYLGNKIEQGNWHKNCFPNVKIQTVIPFIDDYFRINSSSQGAEFKSLCLNTDKRQNCPVFADNFIRIKLLQNQFRSSEFYTLSVTNIHRNSLKIRVSSGHDEFKIVGQSTKTIESERTVEYLVQTHVKDLNLRFPIFSFFIDEQNKGNKNGTQNQLKYNVPLPLTLVEFTEFSKDISLTYESNSQQFCSLVSQVFYLNNKYETLKQCFYGLNLIQRSIKNIDSIKGFNKANNKSYELCWEGKLRHHFIENIEVLGKFLQIGNQVKFEFAFKKNDKINYNYATVMIQVLMSLLK